MFWIIMPMVGLLLLVFKKARDLMVTMLRQAGQSTLGAFVAIGFIGFILTGCGNMSAELPAFVSIAAAVLFWLGIFSAFESARRSTAAEKGTADSPSFQATRIEDKPVERKYSKLFQGDDNWKLEQKDLPSFIRIAGERNAKKQRRLPPVQSDEPSEKEHTPDVQPSEEKNVPEHIQARDSLVRPWESQGVSIMPALGLRPGQDESEQEAEEAVPAEDDSTALIPEPETADKSSASIPEEPDVPVDTPIEAVEMPELEEDQIETLPDPTEDIEIEKVTGVKSIFSSPSKADSPQQKPDTEKNSAEEKPDKEETAGDKPASRYVYKPTMVDSKFSGNKD